MNIRLSAICLIFCKIHSANAVLIELDFANTSQDVCPKASNAICNRMFAPVTCGAENDCWYESQCVASAADETFTAETCCPAVSDVCPEKYSPHTCIRKSMDSTQECKYSNWCKARGAFNMDWLCSPDESGMVSPVPTLAPKKPTENERTVCSLKEGANISKCRKTKKINMLCGKDECPITNSCVARQMGFGRKQCTDLLGCPLPKKKKCSDKPKKDVVCGDCKYNSKCEARTAGFNVKEECSF